MAGEKTNAALQSREWRSLLNKYRDADYPDGLAPANEAIDAFLRSLDLTPSCPRHPPADRPSL